MKKLRNLIIAGVILLVCFICLITHNNSSVIKSVKSERQLLNIYEDNSSINFFERMLTLPFSVLGDHYYYGVDYRYSKSYAIEDEEFATNQSVATPSSSKDYSKTNIQVEGVDEADIIKTDGDYIYSISENKVIITNTKDENNVFIEYKLSLNKYIPNDLLLYKNYLVVISSSSTSNSKMNTLVEVYDVSDKSNVKRVKSFELYEPYYTTRCIDGKLYVFSKGYLRKTDDKIERKYIEDFINREIEFKDIKYIKDNLMDVQTLIAELDLNKIDNVKVSSYLIDISNAYVSKNNIYLLDDTYYEDHIDVKSLFGIGGIIGFINSVDDYSYESQTRVYKFEINKDKGVVFDSTTLIEGSIVNQYSVDESNNHLRMSLETEEGTRIAILDENLKLIGQTDKVAEGERMYATRFIGSKAYLVTYRNTDPLFVIDLSDEKNPKVMGELKIPGYSTYLHPYDENHLIGIGMDTEEIIDRDYTGRVTSTWVRTNGMKMAIFDVSDVTNPKEIAKTSIGDSRTVSAILTNPKALLFSKDKNLLAIPVNNYTEDFEVKYSDDYSTQINNYVSYNKKYVSEGYFVYNVDLTNGFELKGIINHEKKYNNYYYYGNSKLLRGVYIDNYLYTASEGYIKVNNLEDLSEIVSLEIK